MSASRNGARALVAALLCAGCGASVVRSGLPAGRTPDGYDERWHHGFLLGLVDASGPYDVASICPHGWSEMRTGSWFLSGALQFLTLGLYTPSTVTIVCAQTAADPPDAPGEEPLPPR